MEISDWGGNWTMEGPGGLREGAWATWRFGSAWATRSFYHALPGGIMRLITHWRRMQPSRLRAAANRRLAPLGRHRRFVVGVSALVAGVMAVFVASALGVLEGSPSKFEANDGNMTVQVKGDTDWNCFTTLSNITVGEGCGVTGKFNTGEAVSLPDPNASTTKDISWKPGQKQDTECPVLIESKNPEKDTFTNVASFSDTNGATKDTYLYGATIRSTANGNASENVELNQHKGTATCSILRTAGDRLIAINYLKGGTEVEIHVLTWITSTTGENSELAGNKGTCDVAKDTPPCWGANEKSLSEKEAEGKANQEEITAKQNGINETALVAGRFAEFGVNLTKAGIIPANACAAFPQAEWESRSSGSSFVSNHEDIEIEHHEISNCGTIKIIKQTNPRGINKVFSFTSTLPKNLEAG